ncbi:hypothetical protein ACV3Q3_12810 [Clostridium perfringens]
MNIERIKRNKARRYRFQEQLRKISQPLADYIDKRNNIKYQKNKQLAKYIHRYEIVHLLIKGITKKIKKTGEFCEEFVICRSFKDYNYNDEGLCGFIKMVNKYWINDDVLDIWCDYYFIKNTEEQLKLAMLLIMKLKEAIPQVKIEQIVDDNHIKYSTRYIDYKETIKISI